MSMGGSTTQKCQNDVGGQALEERKIQDVKRRID